MSKTRIPFLVLGTLAALGAVVPRASAQSLAAGPDVRWVAAASHAPGAAGSTWRTDLSVLNTCSSQVTVELRLHRSEGIASRSYTIEAGAQQLFPDVVASLVSVDATGSLEISPSGPVLVASRTYNAASTGTFGQGLDGIAASAGLSAGGSAFLLGLAENGSFRTNVGLLNMGTTTAAVDVHLMTTTGAEVGTFHLDVPAGLLVQDPRPYLQRFGRSDIAAGFARVDVASGSGVWAYASVVDNATGDPTTVEMKQTSGECSPSNGNTLTITLPGNVALTLLRIPAGSFTMGSPVSESGRADNEGPQHLVTISKDYWLGETEITQDQWMAVMGSNPSSAKSCGGDCPVEQVSWNDVCGGTDGAHCAQASFIGQLNALAGTSKFRLPTEAEWEFAARAGTIGRFSFNESPICGNACEACSSADPYVFWCANAGTSPHPVKSKQANPLGLFGMHGNVTEWVADWYGSYTSAAATDPTGPASGSWRVDRGGDWGGNLQFCRSASRVYVLPDYRKNRVGFRLARTD